MALEVVYFGADSPRAGQVKETISHADLTSPELADFPSDLEIIMARLDVIDEKVNALGAK